MENIRANLCSCVVNMDVSQKSNIAQIYYSAPERSPQLTVISCLTRFPEQRSDKVYLVTGKYYYIRAYQKADKLGDCASVAVELPSGHFEGPIKRKHLSWKLPGMKSRLEFSRSGLYSARGSKSLFIFIPSVKSQKSRAKHKITKVM